MASIFSLVFLPASHVVPRRIQVTLLVLLLLSIFLKWPRELAGDGLELQPCFLATKNNKAISIPAGLYKVCLSDVNEKLGAETLDELRNHFGTREDVHFTKCDVTSTASVEALYEDACRKFGGRIDLWVNNAGVMGN